MYIDNELREIKLPDKYIRRGKECFYDHYRAKLIPVTPEEVVRQKVAMWCETKLHTPFEMIIVEQHLSHYQIDSKERADIIIHEQTPDGLLPLAVIECKAPSVFLSEKVFQQCFNYADLLQTEYAIVTNGVELQAYKYNQETHVYDQLSAAPSYEEMLGRAASMCQPEAPMPRPAYESLFCEKTQEQYIQDFIIGSKTSPKYRAYAINLLEALLDGEHTVRIKDASFEIIKDLGVRILSYGNAAGFDYVAPYRSFLIKDKTGSNQIISLGFNAYGNDKTILCVAIDDFKKSHHALQLLFDKYVSIIDSKMIFSHSGKITVGHKGSAATTGLLTLVSRETPQLLKDDGKLHLGVINAEANIILSSDDVSQLVKNLFEYALVRDEFRANLQGEKNG